MHYVNDYGNCSMQIQSSFEWWGSVAGNPGIVGRVINERVQYARWWLCLVGVDCPAKCKRCYIVPCEGVEPCNSNRVANNMCAGGRVHVGARVRGGALAHRNAARPTRAANDRLQGTFLNAGLSRSYPGRTFKQTSK